MSILNNALTSQIKIHVDREPFYGLINVRIGAIDKTRAKISYAQNITFQDIEEGTGLDPTLQIEDPAAQALMDQLWNCGIRPTEGHGSAGAMAATQEHLKDLRKIVFHALKIES